MKISFSTHFYVSERLEERHIAEVLSLGYRDVELWAMKPHFDIYDDEYVEKTFRYLAGLGLRINSYHAPIFSYPDDSAEREWLYLTDTEDSKRREAVKAVKETIEVMSYVNPEIAVVHADLRGGQDIKECLSAVRKSLDELLPVAEKTGTLIAVENTQSSLLVKDIAGIVNEYSSSFLGVCIDFGHANLYEDPLKSISHAGRFLVNTHISDNLGDRDIHLHPGKGNIRWGDIAVELTAWNYRGPLTLEVKRSNGLEGIRCEEMHSMFFTGKNYE